MSAVCVMTPMVVGAWPAVVSVVGGVAATLGFTIVQVDDVIENADPVRRRVETEVPHSEVLDQAMGLERIILERDGVRIEVGRDERGAIKLCVSGEGHSKAELHRIGEEVAGRIVQQYAYHKIITELKDKQWGVVEESMQTDGSIQMRVRSMH